MTHFWPFKRFLLFQEKWQISILKLKETSANDFAQKFIKY